MAPRVSSFRYGIRSSRTGPGDSPGGSSHEQSPTSHRTPCFFNETRIREPRGHREPSFPRPPKDYSLAVVYLVGHLYHLQRHLHCFRAITAFSYYGMVLFTTVLFQSHDECHGGLFSNGTQLEVCQPLTRSDYFDLLSTTLAEFPGLIITVLIIEWFGRKKTMALEYAIFAVFTFLLYFCLDRS